MRDSRDLARRRTKYAAQVLDVESSGPSSARVHRLPIGVERTPSAAGSDQDRGILEEYARAIRSRGARAGAVKPPRGRPFLQPLKNIVTPPLVLIASLSS